MNIGAALVRPDEADEASGVDRHPVRNTRYAWVELSIVEARMTALEAMTIVARSRLVRLSSKRGLPPDAFGRDRTDVSAVSSADP